MQNIKEYYQTKYKGSLFVVKAGGRVITDDKSRKSLLKDIQELVSAGAKVLLIYGGGHAIDEALEAAGVESKKKDGRRITTADSIGIIQNVMAADLGYRIASSMAELKLHGLCLSAIPAGWVNIALRPRDPKDYGYDGTIREVYSDQVHNIFKGIPFIACPCLGVTDKNGVNINADDVAVTIASGCKARKLIFLTDVDGVLMDGKTVPLITDQEIPKLIESGVVDGGMRVKLENCLDALNNGVRRIHLINGFQEGALAHEIYETTGPTTMIIKEEDRQRYLNEVETQKAIEAAINQTQKAS